MSHSLPSVDDTASLRLLPTGLSLTAGSADVISFMWHGLFVAHVTGNIILVAARIVAGSNAGLAAVLSVPVFVAALGVANVAIIQMESAHISSLRPMLACELVLLAAFLGVALEAGTHGPAGSAPAVIALMLGVCALSTQNALNQSSVRGAPSTAVMTTNLTLLMHDLAEVVLGRGQPQTRAARRRAARTWPVVVGFGAGAACGAALYAAVGIASLALPVGLVLVILVSVCQRQRPGGG